MVPAAKTAALLEVIGRQEEVSTLGRFLDAIQDGAAALVIEGEAGIGKTTLWRAGIALARERGCAVLSCSPVEAETKLAFAAMGDLLDGLLGEVVDELPGPQRRALRAALLEEDVGARPPGERALALALLGVVRAIGRRSHALIAVDDAQWLDPSSAAVIAFAARRLRDERVGLLVSLRSDGLERLPLDLDRSWPEERLQRLAAGPMTTGALHRLVHTKLGVTFPRPTLHQLVAMSGGNPFYALEIARALQRLPRLPPPDRPVPLPTTLAELVQDRLGALPPETGAALLAAAALREATVPLVEKATRGEATWQYLQPAVEAHVVELERERIRFTHPLLATAVYTQASAEHRRMLHRRLAAIVASLEERARHLALSATPPDADVAAALEEAAERAWGRGASIAAAELLEQAARFTPPDRPADLARRGTRAADRLFAIGETARGQRLLAELRDTLAPGVRRARVLQRLGTSLALSNGFHLGVPVLRQAVDEAGDDAALAAEIEGDLTNALFHSGDLRIARRHARRGLRLATMTGAPALMAALRALVAHVDFNAGRPVPASDAPGDSAPEVLDRQPGFFAPAEYEAMRRKWSDDFDRARVSFARLRDAYLAREEGGRVPAMDFHLAELECWAGNWDAARQHIQDAAEVEEQTVHPTRAVPYHSVCLRAMLSANLGQVETARAAAEASLAETERAGDVRYRIRALGVLGFLELSLGNPRAAVRFLDEAGRLVRETGCREPGVFRIAADEIEALIGVGELEQARLRLEKLSEQGRRRNRAWALATAGRCRALLVAGEGDVEQALSAAENALREHERLPQPFERARTLLVQGSVRRRARQRRAARESLEEALAVFEHLGAALWAQRAGAELRRIGGRAPAGGVMTPTEERIAALVAEGRTNREVAGALFVTVRTVEANLSRIYRKLGVRSRSQLARRLAREREASTL